MYRGEVIGPTLQKNFPLLCARVFARVRGCNIYSYELFPPNSPIVQPSTTSTDQPAFHPCPRAPNIPAVNRITCRSSGFVCGGGGVPETGFVPGPVRVDCGLQPGPGAPQHVTICLCLSSLQVIVVFVVHPRLLFYDTIIE